MLRFPLIIIIISKKSPCKFVPYLASQCCDLACVKEKKTKKFKFYYRLVRMCKFLTQDVTSLQTTFGSLALAPLN